MTRMLNDDHAVNVVVGDWRTIINWSNTCLRGLSTVRLAAYIGRRRAERSAIVTDLLRTMIGP